MRRATTYNLAFQVCVPLLAIVCWALPGSLQASIILPEEVPFNLEQLLAQRDAAKASSSAKAIPRRYTVAAPSSNMPTDIPSSPGELLLMLSAVSTFSTAEGGSNSGTSASSSGSGGTTICPIDSTAALSYSTTDLVRWISGELRLAFPMPPGTDLLRPPQTV
jgi:hypothetical protein